MRKKTNELPHTAGRSTVKRYSKNRARYWVLRQGQVWFAEMRDIGPRCTADRRGEAARFKSKREAMQSHAYSHALSNFTPEAVR